MIKQITISKPANNCFVIAQPCRPCRASSTAKPNLEFSKSKATRCLALLNVHNGFQEQTSAWQAKVLLLKHRIV